MHHLWIQNIEEVSANNVNVSANQNFRHKTLHNSPAAQEANQSLQPLTSLDAIKQVVKNVLKSKGIDEEPSEQAIGNAMKEFQNMNKVPNWRH